MKFNEKTSKYFYTLCITLQVIFCFCFWFFCFLLLSSIVGEFSQSYNKCFFFFRKLRNSRTCTLAHSVRIYSYTYTYTYAYNDKSTFSICSKIYKNNVRDSSDHGRERTIPYYNIICNIIVVIILILLSVPLDMSNECTIRTFLCVQWAARILKAVLKHQKERVVESTLAYAHAYILTRLPVRTFGCMTSFVYVLARFALSSFIRPE